MIYSMRALAGFLLVFALRGDDLTQKMTARLSEEAEAFLRLAPQVLGRETLHQKAIKPPRRFHPRAGAAAAAAPKEEWQERELVSEYGFTGIGTALRELRQVTSVDGRRLNDPRKAQQELARAITAKDEQRLKEAGLGQVRRRLLQQYRPFQIPVRRPLLPEPLTVLRRR